MRQPSVRFGRTCPLGRTSAHRLDPPTFPAYVASPTAHDPTSGSPHSQGPGESYCSCPDFRKNTLGTCKHIIHALGKVRRRFPASVKSQRRGEIHRFSERSCQIVLGSAEERASQYENDCFFTVCNYEQVLRDILSIERTRWDLIILDEGQRIKNWETRTTQIIKSLRSQFALVLTGTPLENCLDDLFSIVEFIDDRRLGPAFRFLFPRHTEPRRE